MGDNPPLPPKDDIPVAYAGIDHVAFAVRDLEQAITLLRDVLGFTLTERRTIKGQSTGMISAEMEHNGIRIVLCQGTEDNSQVSRLVSAYGPGVAHIALAVDDVHKTATTLQRRGMTFDTEVIDGMGLTQTFTSRCQNTGMCFEFIKRDPGKSGFDENNIERIFGQLEQKGAF